jgi:small subunit ribosomal protein S16
MVKLRMRRLGNRNRPFYRLHAVDSRVKRNGRVIEELGHYDPLEKDPAKQVKLDVERCAYWLSVGAQPSDTVRSIIRKAGVKTDSGTKIADQTGLKPATPVAPATA